MDSILNTVLLVDDDEATNFIHKMVVKQTNYAKNIVVRENGLAALEYLTTAIDGKYPKPDIIFLDINMPAINGWEFLEKYKNLDDNQLAKTIIVMLTTSLNPNDKQRAQKLNNITGFISKPLTTELLEKIVEKHFTV